MKKWNHKMDGIDHVNAYLHSNNDLGQYLSNLTTSPVNTVDGQFTTIEGYWHWLGIPAEAGDERDQLRTLSGPFARNLGQKLRRRYGTVERDDFQLRIRLAIRAKLAARPDLVARPEATLPVAHYYVSRCGCVVDQSEKFGWLVNVWAEEIADLRNALSR